MPLELGRSDSTFSELCFGDLESKSEPTWNQVWTNSDPTLGEGRLDAAQAMVNNRYQNERAQRTEDEPQGDLELGERQVTSQ